MSVLLASLAWSQSDDPCGAPVLTVNTSCTYTGGTNATATASAGVPAPGCASYSGGDVWYQVTVPAGGALTVETATGVITDGGMAIYSGACSGLTLIECDDDDGPGAMSLITLTGQTPGAVLYVRVWEYGNNNNGTFSICASQPPPPPTNDDPCSATPLTVNTSCVYTATTNASATASTGIPAPGCASYGGGDVWFSIVVPAGGSVTVETGTAVVTDGGMAIYSGTCGALTLIECDDDDGPGAMSSITLTGQTPGATLFVRAWEYGNNNNGTFNICASQPAPPPANDDPCAATALPVNASCLNTAATNASATSSVGVPAPGCASYLGGDVWFTIVVPAGGAVEVQTTAGVMTDGGMAIYSGTCGALTLIQCDDNSGTGLMSSITLGGQTPGATLFVRVWEFGNNNNGTFSICASIPPPPPANDDPCTATPLTVNASCTFIPTTNAAATGTVGAPAPGCASYSGGDIWFTVVVPASGNIIVETNPGVVTDGGMALYSGTCAALTLIECDDDDGNGLMPSITLNGQTPGATLFVRVWEYGNNNNGAFEICAHEPPPPPPPPANDDCAGALSGIVNASGCGVQTTGTIGGATASVQNTASCFGTENDDVWFSFVAPATGSMSIALNNVAGTTTDLYHSVWTGVCPALTLFAGSCSDPNNSIVTGLTPGATYYVRVNSWGSTSGQITTFDLCLQELDACGGAANNDWCQAPATLTTGAGSFSSNTSSTYTSDTPANLNTVFCGSVENNSWYEFTASATTETFNFTSVTGCFSGIQAEVYNVTADANGCCTNFTSMSNCWNPGTATPGVVTATGLTIGNTYVLMVDGFGGDVCDFAVNNWTATNILPVELVGFFGAAMPQENILQWQTASEIDNDHFIINRSYDGMEFTAIGTVDGVGNSTTLNDYTFSDQDVRTGTTYYHLTQVDVNGSSVQSEIVAVKRSQVGTGLLGVFPNPTNDLINVEVNTSKEVNGATIELSNAHGQIIEVRDVNMNGFGLVQFDTAGLNSGVYFVRYISSSGLSTIKKIIKN
ncbi:MAG: T9SS type A sorting domain-containing protein [Crocinitomicaceae bacterium]|nr:T9SS type A sorting domain-containing protein [Crocinitomicaceae bacterium]